MNRTLALLIASLLAGAASSLAMADPASAPPPGAPTVDTKTFDDWLVRCPKTPQPLPCDAVQMLIEPKSQQRVLSLSIAYDVPNARNVVRIVLPLGISLPNGVTIVAGETKIEKVVVRRCEQFGCVVEGLLDHKLQEAMRKGGDAKIVVFDQAAKPLDLKFSLKGFAAAQDEMVQTTKLVKPPVPPPPAKPN